MTWKVPVFDMFYVISQPFFKISTWNFVHIFMRHCPHMLHMLRFFVKILIWGKLFRKEKNGHFFLILPHRRIIMLSASNSASIVKVWPQTISNDLISTVVSTIERFRKAFARIPEKNSFLEKFCEPFARYIVWSMLTNVAPTTDWFSTPLLSRLIYRGR